MIFYNYELSKYKNDELANEWTSICDINKIFNMKKLTNDMYLEVETNYIESIKMIMQKFSINSLIVMDLEKNSSLYLQELTNNYPMLFKENLIATFDKIKEGMVLKDTDLDIVLRLNLREIIYCNLYSDKRHFVIRPNMDFYIEMICPKLDKTIISGIEKLSLYLRKY